MKAFTLLVMFFCVGADYMDKFTLRILVELYAFDLDICYASINLPIIIIINKTQIHKSYLSLFHLQRKRITVLWQVSLSTQSSTVKKVTLGFLN